MMSEPYAQGKAREGRNMGVASIDAYKQRCPHHARLYAQNAYGPEGVELECEGHYDPRHSREK